MRTFVDWIQSLGYAIKGAHALRKGDDDGVIHYFSLAIETSPDDLEYYYARGNAYWRKGELGFAANDFSTVLRLNPNDFYAHMQRSRIYRERGYIAQAIHDLDWVLDVEDLPLAHYLRASCYAEEHDYKSAMLDLDEAMKTHPHSEKVLHLREWCEHEMVLEREKAAA